LWLKRWRSSRKRASLWIKGKILKWYDHERKSKR
jgi:hypothetical protein